MEEYKQNTEKVLCFLRENNFSDFSIRVSSSCYQMLAGYLEQNHLSYSSEASQNWFASIQETISGSRKSSFHMSLLRLQDVYETGVVQSDHAISHGSSFKTLCPELQQSMDDYVSHLQASYAESTIRVRISQCSRFLISMQARGIACIRDISYLDVCSFYEEDAHNGKWQKGKLNGTVSDMLRFFYSRGDVPYSLTILLHYLSQGQGCFWNEVPEDVHDRIHALTVSTSSVSTEVLHSYQLYLDEIYTKNEYSHTYHVTLLRAIDLLILFLDMNGYCYTPEIARIWADSIHYTDITQDNSSHRALELVAQYHNSSKIQLKSVFHKRAPSFDRLPEWCREPAKKYVFMREQEGWARSTLDMIRSSICRFCNFMDQSGLRSYKEITTVDIKRFNEQDIHKTPAGKNAYNSRIRKFLLYLGENGYLTNPMLFVSLTCKSAPKETLVVVLNEKEMEQLHKAIHDEDSNLSLRKKAMLLLGLKMGMRASDIVSLRIDDIDWDSATVRFVQNKTQVEISLPMPTEVGNALFRYITAERHPKKVPEIFLSENAPYDSLTHSAGERSLKAALPDRHVEGSGFHVTRRTFATEMLKKDVGVDMVVNALGQQSTASVHRYLSLDTERMRMCPLSLKECGLGGWNNE